MTSDHAQSAAGPSGPLAVCLLALAVALAYGNSLSGPFIFDDLYNLIDNFSMQTLWPLTVPLSPPPGLGLSGRPLVNLSFAVNYAISGKGVLSYHLLNIAIHLGCAVALFFLLIRAFTFMKTPAGPRVRAVALAGAAIFALHPLATEAVSFVVQRCESLMALFLLLSFYFALRGFASARRTAWHACAVASGMLGIYCKEVIVCLPLLVWLFDKTFVTPKGEPARRASPVLYWGYLLFYALMVLHLAWGGSSTSGALDKTQFAAGYLRTQPEVILHYVKLVFWPKDLVMDYGWEPIELADAWPAIAALALMLAATVRGVVRKSPLAYAAAWFFLCLAPSSLTPLPDLAFEHRIYAALAGPAAAAACLLDFASAWLATRLGARQAAGNLFRAATLVLLSLLATRTIFRNLDYRYEYLMVTENARLRPENPRVWLGVAGAALEIGRPKEAVEAGLKMLALKPKATDGMVIVGVAKERLKDYSGAIEYYSKAAAMAPHNIDAWSDLGTLLAKTGHLDAGLVVLRQAVANAPYRAMSHINLGAALTAKGKTEEARAHFEYASGLAPGQGLSELNLGGIDLARGDFDASAGHFRQAFALEPKYKEIFATAARALDSQGRVAEAAFYYRFHLRMVPDDAATRERLAAIDALLAAEGKTEVRPRAAGGGSG